MNIETLIRFLFVSIFAAGFVVGCGDKEPAAVPAARDADQPTQSSETLKSPEESPAQKYGRLYKDLLKQKELKEGLLVNIGAETKKKVAAFRQASPEARAKLLEDLEKQVNEYNAGRDRHAAQ